MKGEEAHRKRNIVFYCSLESAGIWGTQKVFGACLKNLRHQA